MSTSVSPRIPQAASPIHSAAFALLAKEVRRFVKVSVQTILAPVISSLLFLVVFAYLLEGRLEPLPGVSYASFLVPGLVMMTLQQNAFANSSSSLTQSKITGNIVFLMLSPMKPWEWLVGYVGGATARGLACGLVVWIASLPLIPLGSLHSPLLVFVFAVCACVVMGSLGLIAALYAERWDHVAAFQNFLINPLTFLAGVFYSVHSLPPAFQFASHLNPFFYLIDGFRYGVFGQGDVTPWISLSASLIFSMGLLALCHRLVASGWRVRH
ncbi:MAG: metal-dependent hydrolase [Betaproteobacteria bacterium]|nr:metal-dependent hydrolase [Betaproteobacteria bacterium]NBT76138.1 metal-dependent hydrolase [Betaproteobacteria bacterium]NBY14136.1 metal-dependent hydrolase [Betaproteobacteria bacterium]NCA16588.1 metal-dependent hydrolase [Betaproteobacteria bacterium]